MRFALVGANGRMGRAIIRLAVSEGSTLVCAVGVGEIGRDAGELAGTAPLGVPISDSLAAVERTRPDVVIDFSVPAATLALAPIAATSKIALVSGTTGLDGAARAALDRAALATAVLWEPNMSVGVHVLSQLVARAAAALADWDVEVVETHHRRKEDAPSGTALRLAEVIKGARADDSHYVHGRQGKPGPRSSGEIGLHALRGGDAAGDHVVHLFGLGERLELAHHATTRDIFAQGALRAARWIVGRGPGSYGFNDVLGGQPPAT
jgi:4-hydroxy-tetrahydrodipicolinate reductase